MHFALKLAISSVYIAQSLNIIIKILIYLLTQNTKMLNHITKNAPNLIIISIHAYFTNNKIILLFNKKIKCMVSL